MFVLFSRSEQSYNSHTSLMPWPSVPFTNINLRQDLTECFNVRGIPYLVLIDNDGNIITENGRAEVAEDADGLVKYFLFFFFVSLSGYEKLKTKKIKRTLLFSLAVFPVEKTFRIFAFLEAVTETSELSGYRFIHRRRSRRRIRISRRRSVACSATSRKD